MFRRKVINCPVQLLQCRRPVFKVLPVIPQLHKLCPQIPAGDYARTFKEPVQFSGTLRRLPFILLPAPPPLCHSAFRLCVGFAVPLQSGQQGLKRAGLHILIVSAQILRRRARPLLTLGQQRLLLPLSVLRLVPQIQETFSGNAAVQDNLVKMISSQLPAQGILQPPQFFRRLLPPDKQRVIPGGECKVFFPVFLDLPECVRRRPGLGIATGEFFRRLLQCADSGVRRFGVRLSPLSRGSYFPGYQQLYAGNGSPQHDCGAYSQTDATPDGLLNRKHHNAQPNSHRAQQQQADCGRRIAIPGRWLCLRFSPFPLQPLGFR